MLNPAQNVKYNTKAINSLLKKNTALHMQSGIFLSVLKLNVYLITNTEPRTSVGGAPAPCAVLVKRMMYT